MQLNMCTYFFSQGQPFHQALEESARSDLEARNNRGFAGITEVSIRTSV